MLIVVFHLVVLMSAVVSEVGVIVVVVNEILVGRIRVPSSVLPLLHIRPEVKVVVVGVVCGGGAEQHSRVVRLVWSLILELRIVSRTGQAMTVALFLSLPINW